jgi:hypothetical protein
MHPKNDSSTWLTFTIPKRKDDISQALEVHRRFVKVLKLKPVRPWLFDFDGMRNGHAYLLDLGDINYMSVGHASLRAVFYKLALKKKLKGIKYYYHRGYVLPETHVRFKDMMKREEEEYGPILRANGIRLEVVPTTVLVKSHGRTTVYQHKRWRPFGYHTSRK